MGERRGKSIESVLDRAVEHYRREAFLRDANLDFAALRRDCEAWDEELAERKLWEPALLDGIEDE